MRISYADLLTVHLCCDIVDFTDESSEGETVSERLKPGMNSGQRLSAKVKLLFLVIYNWLMIACNILDYLPTLLLYQRWNLMMQMWNWLSWRPFVACVQFHVTCTYWEFSTFSCVTKHWSTCGTNSASLAIFCLWWKFSSQINNFK